MPGRAGEIAETFTRRRVDVCCVQETRGGDARMVTGRNDRYKPFWIGFDWNWWCWDYGG